MMIHRYRKYFSVLSVLIIVLMVGIALGACKSKKKSSQDTPDSNFLAAPSSAALKNPQRSPSFRAAPTFTIQGVQAGDTIQLFKDATCAAEAELGSGVVDLGQTSLDITIDTLPAVGTYAIYAQRTNAQGLTSACSRRLYLYQLIGCPDDSYVPVEGNEELGVDPFCVMKTEAKKINNIATAQYAGSPWVNLQADTAKAACQNINIAGATCDLISNPQWMAIARDIEATAANWSGGEVGSGTLTRGHSDASPSNALSISDPDYPWDQTNNPLEEWDQRRTFVLSNGEVLWDFAGNVSEWVDWTTGGDTFAIGPYACEVGWQELFSIDCEGLLPNDYLPGNPANIPVGEYTGAAYGLGKIYGTDPEKHTEDIAGAARRGGLWNYHEKSGIYDLYLNSAYTYKSSSIGFRCVCPVTGD